MGSLCLRCRFLGSFILSLNKHVFSVYYIPGITVASNSAQAKKKILILVGLYDLEVVKSSIEQSYNSLP